MLRVTGEAPNAGWGAATRESHREGSGALGENGLQAEGTQVQGREEIKSISSEESRLVQHSTGCARSGKR